MSKKYFKFPKEIKEQIVHVLECLAGDPCALQQFLDDRDIYLHHYRIDRKPLSPDTIMAFSYDVNEQNMQFSLGDGQAPGIKVEPDPNDKTKQKITIPPDTQVIAKHADGSPFFINDVLIQGHITANDKGGSMELNTWNEPIHRLAGSVNIFSICIDTDSDLISLQGEKTAVIGPNLKVKAIACSSSGVGDRDLLLSGFVNGDAKSLILQFLDVTDQAETDDATHKCA